MLNVPSKHFRKEPGMWSMSHGREIYAAILEWYTGTNLTAQQVL